MKKFSVLVMCGIFAIFLAFFIGYSVGHNSRGFVVIEGDTANGLWPVVVKPIEKDVPPVDINTATKEEIMTIPGVGESYAEDILALREKKGRLDSVWDLDVISGFGETKIAQLAPYMIFS